MNRLPFLKMHGCGNDFVVIDGRDQSVALSKTECRAIADRHFGIGCDQIVLMEPSERADIFMRLYNADGGEVGACGNATRCVAWLIMQESGNQTATIETRACVLTGEASGERQVRVDMGHPVFDWQAIPLAKAVDYQNLAITQGDLRGGFAVGMGNPHCVFFVDNVKEVDINQDAATIEHHALYPERTNVELVEHVSDTHLMVRVWERGVGETLACGTGACAAFVAAHRNGMVKDKANVSLAGGDLIIEWNGHGAITMTGPVATVFEGVWQPK